MREVLLDLVKQTSGLTEALRVNGTAEETSIKGCDADKTLFIEAKLKVPLVEFEGEFGLTNMSMLSGLLNFTNYLSDDATFTVKRRERNGATTVEQFEFRNKVTGNEADFRMMDPAHVPEQATIPNIPWDVSVVPTKSKITEFSQLSNLYSEISKAFGVRTVGGDLQFYIGDESSASHRASMTFANEVKGELKGNLQWNTHQFLAIMKMTGSHPTELKFTNRGVLSIEVDTPHGVYNYFLRANRGQ
jgi:hypothetical protein